MAKRKTRRKVVRKKSTALAVHKPQVPQSEAVAFINMIERASRDPAIDVNKLKELLAIRNQEQDRVARQAFAASMVECQNGMVPVKKDMQADRFKYASYEAVDEKMRPIYSRHDFSLSFNSEPIANEPNRLLVICDVLHRMGCERRYTVPITVSTTGPQGGKVMTQTQGEGAAVSFGRRYLLLMIFNIVTTEDDIAVEPQKANRLTPDQVKYLEGRIANVGINKAKTLEAYGVTKLEDIPASKFDEVDKRLTEYQKKKTAGVAA